MAGRVERELDAVAGQDLAVVRGLDRDVAEALFQDRRGQRMADVEVGAEAGVIGVRMGDDGAGNRPPRVDMKVAGLAIEASVGRCDQVHAARRQRKGIARI